MPSPSAEPCAGRRVASAVQVAAGLLTIILWPCAWFVWGALSLMGTLMANDAGRASTTAHTTLVLGMLAGQVLAGAAGIPLGLGFFWRDRRRLMLWIFAALLAAGLLAQALAVAIFFLGVSPS